MRIRFAMVAGLALAALALSRMGGPWRPVAPGPAAGSTPAARVVEDRAGLLGAFDRPIRSFADGIRRDLGVDVRVLTLRDESDEIEALAERAFHALGVGDGARAGGVLVVVEAARSRARIEVSYTLEGVLPDALLSRLARDQLAPYASYQAVGMGVMDVVSLLQSRLRRAAEAGEIDAPRAHDRLAGRSGGGGAQVPLPDVPFDRDLKRPLAATERERYQPSADASESVEAFLRTQRDLVGDPTLELFTEGSRVLRARYPVAPYEEWERFAASEASRPLEIRSDGDHAIADAAHPAPGFVPILLARSDGVWRVDLVETFKNYRVDPSGGWYMENAANPYVRLARARPRFDFADVVPVPLDEPLADAIARREAALATGPAPADAARLHFELAELLYRNAWAVVAAIVHYEEAARLAPAHWELLDTYARRGSFIGLPELAIPALERAGPRGWSLAGLLYEEAGKADDAERAWRRVLSSGAADTRARRGLERLARRRNSASG